MMACPYCDASGEIPGRECPACKGEGSTDPKEWVRHQAEDLDSRGRRQVWTTWTNIDGYRVTILSRRKV